MRAPAFLRQLRRLITIQRTLTLHGIDRLLLENSRHRWLIMLNRLLPWNWGRRVRGSRGERIRLALEALGPIFIKFGQALSTRKDLLPDDIGVELSRLQDDCPPFDPEQARAIIEAELGQPLDEAFARFDLEPMASASIAQVHAATLPSGMDVVVKVVRPDIQPVIEQDLEILYTLAKLLETLVPEARRLHPVEVVHEFDKTLHDELDMMREGANASQLRRHWEGSDLLYVPRVFWDLTTPRVLTMERIYGTRISEIDELQRQGVDLERLSRNGVIIFFTQVFKHNFFHADMHPGNIFVLPDGRYAAIDFGIMGSLTPEDQRYLAENFLAFFNQDYLKVAELHIESGWVPPDTRVNELEAAFRAVSEPIWGRPIKEISFGLFLMRLFQTARRFGMEVQPQLVLLQKTLLNIEGLGRQLNDELDLWDTAKPFLEEWMKERVGLRGFVRSAREELPYWLERAPELPKLIHRVLDDAVHRPGQPTTAELRALRQELIRSRRAARNRTFGIMLVVLSLLPVFPLGLIEQGALMALGLLLVLRD
ncbi:ubiquinone biosynthesis regulatory protein kinase UbiB [Sulfurivirga sp.]|uniref:ubiquinone biosynthesis regulatory protein kinase UbiB n=1 Tax=Sulfurivirga sp. TaxID=2614236 RepID=UPI0025D54107|nr:ubiquinone biosynthesis regulatory protein kinase UbiB [Sulfurivirga sp.]